MSKTRAEYIAEAVREMEQAAWNPTKWAEAIENGYPPGTPYKYEGTHNFKAQQALWNAVHPPTPPPNPTPPTVLPSPNRCLYFSTVDQDTINWVSSLGRGFTALFSADLNLAKPGGPYWVTDEQTGLLVRNGVTVASWSDCSATPYKHAVELAKRPNFSFAGGQAEDAAQWHNARSSVPGHPCIHIIGNPNQLADEEPQGAFKEAVATTNAGTVAFIGEVLHPDPSYSAQGVNISSACMYVDMDEAHGGYQPLASFDVMPPGLKVGASIYTPGVMREADRTLYRQWTRG